MTHSAPALRFPKPLGKKQHGTAGEVRESVACPTEPTPGRSEYVPHIELLLQGLHVSRDRLNSTSKIAVEAKLLRKMIEVTVRGLPFSEQFYTATYPDIRAAADAGQIVDLHQHFVETGFFEGRLGAAPAVDETYYTSLYEDVGLAIERGDIGSATDHYIASGSAEGRVPNVAVRPHIESWMTALFNDLKRIGR
jgi:hypothetical protein